MGERREKWRAWTEEEDAKLGALWPDTSKSPEDVAKAIGRTLRGVEERAMLLKIRRRPTNWTPEIIDRTKVLWNSGLSATEIAVKLKAEFNLHLSRNAVCGKLDRLGCLAERTERMGRPAATRTNPPRKAKKPALVKDGDRYANHALAATLTHMKRRQKAQGESSGPKFKCEPVPETVIPPGANPKILADLDTSCECRWPMGSPPPVGQGDQWLFCADARAEGSIYCGEHKRKSVAATRTSAEKAADAARMAKMKARALANKSANSNAHAFLFAKHVRAA